ncbi:hypothetical protein FJQ98_20260 [Lysinibacillus agricola]|uniref:Uncharacterized protein n=1 Tax=Lysinibacillus agricola TaxID=2590012 RepID=A0ABX7APQ8_9BACI|nr:MULTISPECIES: hypothetical protein [Lysinibacillus]QQP11512.1 hypothetical protein FJQ98_20260 [Lysinibacillus agricola]
MSQTMYYICESEATAICLSARKRSVNEAAAATTNAFLYETAVSTDLQ